MDPKTFSLTAGVIFLLVAFLHALRILFGWHVSIGGWEAPVWISWLALIIAGYLGYKAIRFGKHLGS